MDGFIPSFNQHVDTIVFFYSQCVTQTPSKKACFAVLLVWSVVSTVVAIGLFRVALNVPWSTVSWTKGENCKMKVEILKTYKTVTSLLKWQLIIFRKLSIIVDWSADSPTIQIEFSVKKTLNIYIVYSEDAT